MAYKTYMRGRHRPLRRKDCSLEGLLISSSFFCVSSVGSALFMLSVAALVDDAVVVELVRSAGV
jgi:hypothetical protein